MYSTRKRICSYFFFTELIKLGHCIFLLQQHIYTKEPELNIRRPVEHPAWSTTVIVRKGSDHYFVSITTERITLQSTWRWPHSGWRRPEGEGAVKTMTYGLLSIDTITEQNWLRPAHETPTYRPLRDKDWPRKSVSRSHLSLMIGGVNSCTVEQYMVNATRICWPTGPAPTLIIRTCHKYSRYNVKSLALLCIFLYYPYPQ